MRVETLFKRPLLQFVDWFPSGKLYVCATADGSLAIRAPHTERFSVDFVLPAPFKTIQGLGVVDEDSLVVVATSNLVAKYRIYLLQRVYFDTLAVVWQAEGRARACKVSPVFLNSCVLVDAFGTKCMDLWNLSTRSVKRYRKEHAKGCVGALAGTSGQVILGGDDGTRPCYVVMWIDDIVAWNRDKGNQIKRLKGHKGHLRGIFMHPTNPNEFTTLGWNNKLIVYF